MAYQHVWILEAKLKEPAEESGIVDNVSDVTYANHVPPSPELCFRMAYNHTRGLQESS